MSKHVESMSAKHRLDLLLKNTHDEIFEKVAKSLDAWHVDTESLIRDSETLCSYLEADIARASIAGRKIDMDAAFKDLGGINELRMGIEISVENSNHTMVFKYMHSDGRAELASPTQYLSWMNAMYGVLPAIARIWSEFYTEHEIIVRREAFDAKSHNSYKAGATIATNYVGQASGVPIDGTATDGFDHYASAGKYA